MNIYDVVPLTIVIDYLKEDVGDKMETFLHMFKLFEKNIDNNTE